AGHAGNRCEICASAARLAWPPSRPFGSTRDGALESAVGLPRPCGAAPLPARVAPAPPRRFLCPHGQFAAGPALTPPPPGLPGRRTRDALLRPGELARAVAHLRSAAPARPE